jgi:Ca2+-binding RTX toxin-like protein
MYVSMRARVACAAAIACAIALTATATAGAANTSRWGCRASTASVQLGTAERLEPVVAGGANPSSCGDAQAGQSPSVIGTLGLETPLASTATDPDGAFPGDQTAGALATAARTEIATPDGSLRIVLGAIRSVASGSCVNGKPVFSGDSSVAKASINGQEIPIEDLAKRIGDGVDGSPLGDAITIRFNEKAADANGISERAAHITVADGQGGTVLDVVAGESRVTATGDVCSNSAANNGGGNGSGSNGTNGTDGTGGDGAPCPSGSSYDPARNLCLIETRTDGGANGQGGDNGAGGGGAGGTVTSVIVVGRPGDVPIGGTVVPLSKLTGAAAKSPCARDPKVAPRFAVVGTNKADRITGSNRADRIILLGGKDKSSGGRGNDCIDGGTGNDTVEGALGNDRLYGMAGNDTLLAGSGNDRSFGGAGNDKIRADYGRDVVDGGSGNDRIVTTTLGPAARVNCGSGKDRARVNMSERKAKSCERKRITS